MTAPHRAGAAGIAECPSPDRREVVVGRNAKVWQSLEGRDGMAARFPLAIGHADMSEFAFQDGDRVWVFSYSRDVQENRRLLAVLARVPGIEVVYVSSASTIVTRVTRCYEYPRVKAAAEADARELLDARVLTLGLVFDTADELPTGRNIATPLDRIAAFMLAPRWPLDGGRRMNLFEVVERPFRSAPERWAHRGYGLLMHLAQAWPCALRPLDALLRAVSVRWYGYIYLSNRQWISTMS